MSIWPDLALPPINLWNMPRQHIRVPPQVHRRHRAPQGLRHPATDSYQRMQALIAMR